jgi:hypothetical protein
VTLGSPWIRLNPVAAKCSGGVAKRASRLARVTVGIMLEWVRIDRTSWDQDGLMDAEELLKKVEAAPQGTTELDEEFAKLYPTAPRDVTRSIDAAVGLVESEFPGWWWTCGYCTLSNDASLYVPGSNRFPYATAVMGPDFRSGPEALRLLEDPKWGRIFDDGFHRDRRGGTVPLALVAVFLKAKIALAQFQANADPGSPWPWSSRR